MKKNIIIISLGLLAMSLLSGCAVAMAVKGKKEPNLGVVSSGVDRYTVEAQLGCPQCITPCDDGTTLAEYQFEVGNEPSCGRAIAHGAMDFLTLGLWEVVGTPVELAAGDTRVITVRYDENNKVISMDQSYIKASKSDDCQRSTPKRHN